MNLTAAGKGEGRHWSLITGALVDNAYKLPDEVVHAVETRQRLYDLSGQLVEVPSVDLAERMYLTARDGPSLPGTDLASLDAIATETTRLAAHQAVVQASYDARERACGAVRGAIRANADEVLDLLRDAHDDAVIDATTLCSKIDSHGLTDQWPDEAPADVRKARVQLKAVGVRYGHIGSARRILGSFLDPCRIDLDGEFAEMTNRADLFTPAWRLPTPAPWDGKAPDARLYLLVRMGAKLWMPSPAEQDAAYATAHPTSTRITGGPAIVGAN